MFWWKYIKGVHEAGFKGHVGSVGVIVEISNKLVWENWYYQCIGLGLGSNRVRIGLFVWPMVKGLT